MYYSIIHFKARYSVTTIRGGKLLAHVPGTSGLHVWAISFLFIVRWQSPPYLNFFRSTPRKKQTTCLLYIYIIWYKFPSQHVALVSFVLSSHHVCLFCFDLCLCFGSSLELVIYLIVSTCSWLVCLVTAHEYMKIIDCDIDV